MDSRRLLVLALFGAAACTAPKSQPSGPGVEDARPATSAPPPPPADASKPTPATTAERRDARAPAPPAPPAPPALVESLAGKGDSGMFWVPVKGEFSDEDLLLQPDGSFVTHFNAHPGSAGHWRVEKDALILDGWLGDRELVIEGLRVTATELRGQLEGKPLVMRRVPPHR